MIPANLRTPIAAVVLLTLSIWASLANTAPDNCSEQYRKDVTVSINSNTFPAEQVSSAADMEKGLAGRSCIGSSQAMLFVFDKPGYYPFWMKDMRFSIDIIWIKPDMVVSDVISNVSPSTYPKTYTNTTPAKYVLELQAGLADKTGIQTGAKVKLFR